MSRIAIRGVYLMMTAVVVLTLALGVGAAGSVAATPTEVEATNTTTTAGTATQINVTVTDGGTTATENVTVSVLANDSLDDLLTDTTAVTDATGNATFTIQPTIAGKYVVEFEVASANLTDTATVTVEADEPSLAVVRPSALSTTVSDNFSDENQLVATVTVEDGFGNGVPDIDVGLSDDGTNIVNESTNAGVTAENGSVIFRIQSTTAQENITFTFSVTNGSFSTEANIDGFTFDSGSVDAGILNVSATPSTVSAGETYNLTGKLTDEYVNPLENILISSRDDSNRTNFIGHVLLGPLTRTVAGTYNETLSAQNLSNTATLTVVPADPAKLTSESTSITKTAGEPGTFTLTLDDEFGNSINGESINVTSAAGLTGIATGNTTTTAGDGSITFSFNETTTGTYNVGFSLLGTAITASSMVTINPDAPDEIEVTLLTLSTTVSNEFGDDLEFTPKVTVFDQYNNRVPDVDIGLSTVGKDIEFEATNSGETDEFGEVTFTIQSTTAQENPRFTFTENESGESTTLVYTAFEPASPDQLTGAPVTETAGVEGSITLTLSDIF